MTATNEAELPEYETPPIVETVCGVTFESLPLPVAHYGLYWSTLQPDFPKLGEGVPLDSTIEIYPGEESREVEFTITGTRPLPRQLFISADENNIIQVQSDRFIFNWRKMRPEDEYPRFSNVYAQFTSQFDKFETLAGRSKLSITPVQYELTYLNHIPHGSFWNGLQSTENVVPSLNLAYNDCSILSKPDTFNFRISFELPNRSGRIYITAKNGIKDNVSVLVLDLTVRGIASDTSKETRDQWFSVAREWIVRGFTDFTSEQMQRDAWRRLR